MDLLAWFDAQIAELSAAKEQYLKEREGVPAGEPVDGVTQEQIDALVAQAREEVRVEMQEKVDQATAELVTAKEEAVIAFKADLKAKYAEQQNKESADEAEIAKLLD